MISFTQSLRRSQYSSLDHGQPHTHSNRQPLVITETHMTFHVFYIQESIIHAWHTPPAQFHSNAFKLSRRPFISSAHKHMYERRTKVFHDKKRFALTLASIFIDWQLCFWNLHSLFTSFHGKFWCLQYCQLHPNIGRSFYKFCSNWHGPSKISPFQLSWVFQRTELAPACNRHRQSYRTYTFPFFCKVTITQAMALSSCLPRPFF